MGNQLDNLQSLTVINNNNTIRLPDFEISYIPPKKEPIVTNNINNLLGTLDFTNNNNVLPVNGNKKVNDDEDDFVSIEEDADKEIKPKESIHQAEMNLVNTLMKEYSVTSIVEEKKKAEEEKKKQEEEEKKKIEEEHQKKLEEAKPKKNLDDLFNLLGDLPQPEVKASTNQIEQQNALTQPHEVNEKKEEDDNDDFVSIEEDNNEQPTTNSQPIPDIITPTKEIKENNKASLLGIEFNVLAPIESKPNPQMIKKEELPIRMTSYSPCFRKEGGSHGLEERGLYRVHQFEKQEMIVLCEPEDSMKYYEQMWKYTVEIFRNMDVPVRQLECCSGDLADLKVKSCDIEAWSPRQQKYFEVGSCSNLGDAQARRLGIRVKGETGNYYLHTLNNTVVASPRGLIAVIENNYNKDGSITIPEVLRPYMGGKDIIK